MGFKDKAVAVGKKFKLDSHHTMERFAIVCGVLAVTFTTVMAGTGFTAWQSGREVLADTTLYTDQFTTSKTQLSGNVDGVYTNELGNKALVVMHFDPSAAISYNAADYQAFLLGSDVNLNSEKVSTEGIEASFHVFGSTGYMGVVLEADEPFDRQVLNLTMRANAELSFNDQAQEETVDALAGDKSFQTFDQWRVFFNPGATGAKEIAALESTTFDPARAFYDVVLASQEKEVREELDTKLIEMRSALARVESYTSDLQTTKVDGVFLRPPRVPKFVRGDKVTGQSAAESKDGTSSLMLKTNAVAPGGFAFNWRAGNVYDGHLDVLVPPGESYAQYLANKAEETTDAPGASVEDMVWTLSDGSSLTDDYRSSEVAMRPLVTVMNNLSQAYQDYAMAKNEYQSTLLLDLLALDVDLRDVQSNSSVNDSEDFILIY